MVGPPAQQSCRIALLALTLHAAADLHPRAPHFLDDGCNLKWQTDAVCAAVLHQLKLAVRRHKAHHLLGIEAPQVDTLVECDVLGGRRGAKFCTVREAQQLHASHASLPVRAVPQGPQQ